jgi:hypothetical protein
MPMIIIMITIITITIIIAIATTTTTTTTIIITITIIIIIIIITTIIIIMIVIIIRAMYCNCYDNEVDFELQVPKVFDNLKLDEIVSMKGRITCQPPMGNLYAFEGRAEIGANHRQEDDLPVNTGPLNIDNILLRGARLKDTDYIFGCAVYTGRDTKLSLNSKISTNKFSTAEKLDSIIFTLILYHYFRGI